MRVYLPMYHDRNPMKFHDLQPGAFTLVALTETHPMFKGTPSTLEPYTYVKIDSRTLSYPVHTNELSN